MVLRGAAAVKEVKEVKEGAVDATLLLVLPFVVSCPSSCLHAALRRMYSLVLFNLDGCTNGGNTSDSEWRRATRGSRGGGMRK